MIYAIIIYCLLAGATSVQAEGALAAHESFLAQPPVQKTNKKKKKSIATLRQEFTQACEVYAHALVEELYLVGSVMESNLAEKKEVSDLLRTRFQQLEKAERFFVSGVCSGSEAKVTGKVAWRLVQRYAQVQEKLLYAITDLLEQNEKSCFMTADKQQLQTYQESIQSLQEESELLVKELRALGK